MSAPPLRGESLARAFRSFERAASGLEERHAVLTDKVERLERSLLDAHRHLEAVLDAVDSGIAVVGPDGTLLRTNPAFETLGLGRKGGATHDPELARLAAVAGTAPATARWTAADATGGRELAATAVPVGDAEGSRVLSVQDVSAIRREEREDGRRRRLESLGRMAAEIAHEVRNPLGSILLFASMLRDDIDARTPQREMVDQILAAVSGLEAAVANLLAFASPARGRERTVDLAALARDSCGLVAPACALRGVAVAAPPVDGSCAVEADPEGLRQVLLNLLGNALAATDAGGTIRVDVVREGDGAVLEVADTGRGIAAEDLPHVFEPFFTRTEGGTGLGLSIVHQIVERHGGRILIDSRPGAGTTVRITLGGGTPPGIIEEGCG